MAHPFSHIGCLIDHSSGGAKPVKITELFSVEGKVVLITGGSTGIGVNPAVARPAAEQKSAIFFRAIR